MAAEAHGDAVLGGWQFCAGLDVMWMKGGLGYHSA